MRRVFSIQLGWTTCLDIWLGRELWRRRKTRHASGIRQAFEATYLADKCKQQTQSAEWHTASTYGNWKCLMQAWWYRRFILPRLLYTRAGKCTVVQTGMMIEIEKVVSKGLFTVITKRKMRACIWSQKRLGLCMAYITTIWQEGKDHQYVHRHLY